MKPLCQTPRLCVLNRSSHPARLRFHCDGLPVWDSWIAAGGRIAVPDPATSVIDAEVSLTHASSNVTYTAPASLPCGGHLACAMTVIAGALHFGLRAEPGCRTDQIALQNTTNAEVRFELRLRGSPFGFATVLPAASSCTIDRSKLALDVVVNGVTVNARIACWDSDVIVDCVQEQGEELPTLQMEARGQQREQQP
jgi:hypothetical protein